MIMAEQLFSQSYYYMQVLLALANFFWQHFYLDICRRINHYMSVLLKSRFLSCFKKYFGQKMYAGLFIKCKRKVFSECYMYILSSRDHELIWVKLSMILFDLTRFPLHIHPRRQGGHSVQQYQERLLPAVWRRDGHSAPLSPQGR